MARSGLVRWIWGRDAPRAIACCGAVSAVSASALAGEGTATAEMVRYVDRDGVTHQIEVAGGSPAASAPAQAPLGAEGEYPFAAAVQEAARLYSLPVELILAVMTIESGFEPKAVSSRGAMGLMQVMPATAADMKIADSFDPRDNLLGGTRYLRICLNDAEGDVVVALGSYNAGPGATQRYGGVPPFRDTHQYVASVVRFYRMYQARGPAFAAVVAAAIRGNRGAAAFVAMGDPKRVPQTPPAKTTAAQTSAAQTSAAQTPPARAGHGARGKRRVASPNKAVVHGEGARGRSTTGEKQARQRRPTRRRRGNG